LPSLRAFIAPSKGWGVRIYALFFFVILDYAMTDIFCHAFTDEANLILRSFMIYFDSIQLGLLAFALSFYGPVYALLCFFSNKELGSPRGMNLIEFISEHKNPLFDIVLGLGVASRHFEGAMSWILPLSNRLWLALGFVFYLAVVHFGTLINNLRS
jgi:hypothetical protein